MSEPIKLPPIPLEWGRLWGNGGRIRYCTEHMQIYARWAVEQNTATLRAERDALKRRLQLHDACNGVMGERGYVPECISLRAERDALRQIVADYPPIEAELREVSDRAFRAEAECDALRAQCGGKNCMGWRAPGVREWVTRERLAEAEAECDALRAACSIVADRLQMDIDDGSRPDQWSMQDMVRTLDAARAALKEAKE